MELQSLKGVSKKSKILLLKELGYDSDETFVLNKDGSKLLDVYTDEPVRIDNMVIVPGSTVVLDDNLLSITAYLEEHGDIF